jgi:hypothetical protein
MTKIERASGRYRRAEQKNEIVNENLRAGTRGQLLAMAFKLLLAKITTAQGITLTTYKAYLAQRPKAARKALCHV